MDFEKNKIKELISKYDSNYELKNLKLSYNNIELNHIINIYSIRKKIAEDNNNNRLVISYSTLLNQLLEFKDIIQYTRYASLNQNEQINTFFFDSEFQKIIGFLSLSKRDSIDI